MGKEWLSPFRDIWKEEMGGEPAWGLMGKYLSPLVDEYGMEEVMGAWRTFLREQDPLYVSMARFSQTYGSWKPKRKIPILP